jgi:DNA-binding MarR family transcriptional regulator
MTDSEATDQVALPALLRGARGSYAGVIRSQLAAAGFEDLPRNGPFVLGGIANHGAAASEIVEGLGITKQAASQLIDTLVLRGYLDRSVNPDDRRRMLIRLTERGQGAAVVVATAIASVDAQLATMITVEEIAGLRAGLQALCEIKGQGHDHERHH